LKRNFLAGGMRVLRSRRAFVMITFWVLVIAALYVGLQLGWAITHHAFAGVLR
jgi:hypothetical protein